VVRDKVHLRRGFEKTHPRGDIAAQKTGLLCCEGDAFLQALADDFEAHGKGVVEKVRTERPQDYLKIVASVMPKRMEVEDVGPPCRAADLSDDELAANGARAKLTVV
jgi:hypothetical protein